MASFQIAIKRPLANEGGYVNHPSDPGGETYRGIARAKHPDWGGWAVIDQYRSTAAFPGVLEADHALQNRVLRFYEEAFWKPIGGDVIQSQEIADEMLDMAIHLGIKRAVQFLQRGLNALNKRGRLYADVDVDGDFGPQTQAALAEYQRVEAPNFLLKALVFQRGAYYVDLVLAREMSEDFIRGWLRRVVVQR